MNVGNKNQKEDNSKIYSDLLARAAEINREENSNIDYPSFLVNPDPQDPNSALSLLYQMSEQSIENEQKRYLHLFQTVESMLNEETTSTKKFEVPPSKSLRKWFSEWTTKPLPIVEPPFTPLCGAMEFPKDNILPPHSYACVHKGEEYLLAFVIGFDPENVCYHCCDADPVGKEVKEMDVPISELIPMPTSVPSKHLKGTYHPVKTRVLAMWPMQGEGSQWTSVFYSASVAQVPITSPGTYKLKFDGQPPMYENVPEHMVVKHPQE